MLTDLHIRHFAIIDSSELELSPGMTALTGETGAGKSILLDALGLILGARASADSIQQGAKRADITASFNIDGLPQVKQWLSDNELDNDECLIRRSINANGKSRASINDVPVSVQSLRSLGSQLVAIHGQHAYQSMGKAAEQRVLLDNFAGAMQLKKVQQSFTAWHTVNEACENQQADEAAREQRIDLIRFQLQEFDDLNIGNTRVEDIESEHRWLANAEQIISLASESLGLIDETASTALSKAIQPLSALVQIDERLREALDLIESAQIQAEESAHLIRSTLGKLEHDDARLAWLDQKLSALHRLTRKHQCTISELAATEQNLRDELDSLSDPANSGEELHKQRDALLSVYATEADKLSRHRRKHAKRLGRTISDAMQTLSMTGGVFEVTLNTDKQEPTVHGNDTISFLVSPNPGVSPAPLAKVASGGELSRISLCIQLATIGTQSVPTLVFDEVDAGVGGAVAETVGQLLRKVGADGQVMCVTHLPQVAAQAHHHLLISKKSTKARTTTSVATLNEKQRCDEIARMLGGSKLTAKTRQHAREMLDSATAV